MEDHAFEAAMEMIDGRDTEITLLRAELAREKREVLRIHNEKVDHFEETIRLRAALKDMFALIDEGWLIRNTANDAESGWGMRQIGFVRRLQTAHAALGHEQGVTK